MGTRGLEIPPIREATRTCSVERVGIEPTSFDVPLGAFRRSRTLYAPNLLPPPAVKRMVRDSHPRSVSPPRRVSNPVPSYSANHPQDFLFSIERLTGFAPATLSLARRYATAAPQPQDIRLFV